MSKFLVTVSVMISNRYQIETNDYMNEPDRVAESQLMLDLDDSFDLPKQITVAEDMSIAFANQISRPIERYTWEVDDISIDDVTLMDH